MTIMTIRGGTRALKSMEKNFGRSSAQYILIKVFTLVFLETT